MFGTAFPHVGIFCHLWGKYFSQISAFQLMNLIKKINIKYEDHQIKILIFKTDDYIDVLIKVLNICIKIYNVHVGIVDEIR